MEFNIIPNTLDIDIPTLGYKIEYNHNEVVFKINKKEQYIIEFIKKLKNDDISNQNIIDKLNQYKIFIDEKWTGLEIEHSYLTYKNRPLIGLQKIKDLPDKISIPIKKLKLDEIHELDFYLWNKKDLIECNSYLCQLRKHMPNIKINVKIGVKDTIIKKNNTNINGRGCIIYKKN
jgi:hypothetical protein